MASAPPILETVALLLIARLVEVLAVLLFTMDRGLGTSTFETVALLLIARLVEVLAVLLLTMDRGVGTSDP